MKKVYKYEGEYGVLEVNLQEKKVIKDELDRDKIWSHAQEDYSQQQYIYSNHAMKMNIGVGKPPTSGSKHSAMKSKSSLMPKGHLSMKHFRPSR